MNKQQKAERIADGHAEIMGASLSSEKQIEAMNIWRAVVFLQDHLEKRSMRIWEVRPDHLIEWIS